jgi:hypothetical protein
MSSHAIISHHEIAGPDRPSTLTRLLVGTTKPRPTEIKRMDVRDKPPPEDDLHGRKLVERVLRDTIKRVVESGVGKITEGPENLRNLVSDLKLPKEIANYLFSQIDETKNGLYRVVAKEIRGFLQQNNLGEEMAKALAHLSVEIKTEIRFVPASSDDGDEGSENGGRKIGRPEVKASVQVKSDRPDPSKPRP